MIKKIILLILLIFFPLIITKAEVYKFFEFLPDMGVKFNLTPDIYYQQKFIPFNDHLSLISILVNNSSTNITNMFLELYDFRNNLISRKNITVPPLPYKRTGNIFNIPLERNYQIESGREYKFSLYTNESNNIEILGFNLIDLLQHTESNIYLPETIRPLFINDQETDKALKFSLYEGNENIPPVISNITTSIDFENKITFITFNSNEPIKYKILYWTNNEATKTKEINYFESCPLNIRNCEINFSIILNRDYYFNLIASDYWLNTSSYYGNFNTYVSEEERSNEQVFENNKNIRESNQTTYSNFNQNNIVQNGSQEQRKIKIEKYNLKKNIYNNQENKKIKIEKIKEDEQKEKINIESQENKKEERTKESDVLITQKQEETIVSKTEKQNQNYNNNNNKSQITQKNYLKIFALVIALLILIELLILLFYKKKK